MRGWCKVALAVLALFVLVTWQSCPALYEPDDDQGPVTRPRGPA